MKLDQYPGMKQQLRRLYRESKLYRQLLRKEVKTGLPSFIKGCELRYHFRTKGAN